MSAPNMLKNIARKLGVFAPARELYVSLSKEHRDQFKKDRDLYSKFVNNGDLIFDIGVNLGQKTRVFLDLGAKVVGAEPNPNCWPILASKALKNDNFQLEQKAVGANAGMAELNFSNTSATASLRQDWLGLSIGNDEVKSTEIEVTTLDDLIEKHGVPSFCKIDVEGFEPEVFKGLSRPLPLISFEFHLVEEGQLRACLAELRRIGKFRFNVIAIDDDHLLMENWVEDEELVEFISSTYKIRRGDVFARHQEAATLN